MAVSMAEMMTLSVLSPFLIEHAQIDEAGAGRHAFQRAGTGGAFGSAPVARDDAGNVLAVAILVRAVAAHEILDIDDAAGRSCAAEVFSGGDSAIDQRHAHAGACRAVLLPGDSSVGCGGRVVHFR